METSVSDEWKRPVNGMSGEMPNVHSCEGGHRGASRYRTIAYSYPRSRGSRAPVLSGLCANKRANYDGRSTKVSRVTREVSALGDVTEDPIAGSQGRRESRVGGGGD